ncbi:unnamed protein product, partial [Cyprideis torosa]
MAAAIFAGEEDICPWDAQVPASPKGKPRIRLPTRALVQAIASVTSKSKELAQASAGTSSGASANTDPSSKRPCDGGTGRYCGIGAAGPSSSLTKVSREAIFYMGKSESSASVSIGDDVCPWESGPPSGTSSISSQKQLLVPEGKPQQKKSASVPEDVGCKDGTPSMASLKCLSLPDQDVCPWDVPGPPASVCPWDAPSPSTSSLKSTGDTGPPTSTDKQLLVPEGKPQQKKSASVPEDVGCKDGTPSMASLKCLSLPDQDVCPWDVPGPPASVCPWDAPSPSTSSLKSTGDTGPPTSTDVCPWETQTSSPSGTSSPHPKNVPAGPQIECGPAQKSSKQICPWESVSGDEAPSPPSQAVPFRRGMSDMEDRRKLLIRMHQAKSCDIPSSTLHSLDESTEEQDPIFEEEEDSGTSFPEPPEQLPFEKTEEDDGNTYASEEEWRDEVEARFESIFQPTEEDEHNQFLHHIISGSVPSQSYYSSRGIGMPQSYPELNIAEPVKGFLETIEEVASVSSTNTEESSGAIAEERIIYLPDITDVEPIPEALQETEEEDHDTLPPPPNEMLEELSSLNESVVEEAKTMTLTSYDSTSTYPSSSTVNAGTTSDLQSTDSSCPVGDKTLSILEGARASLEILDSHSCVSEEPLTVMSSVMPIPESTETDESLSCRHVV